MTFGGKILCFYCKKKSENCWDIAMKLPHHPPEVPHLGADFEIFHAEDFMFSVNCFCQNDNYKHG
jgi:hypothetical protein